jgi:hypothetical protein
MNQPISVLNQLLLIGHQLTLNEVFFFLYDVVIIQVIQSILDQSMVQVYTLLDRTIQKKNYLIKYQWSYAIHTG